MAALLNVGITTAVAAQLSGTFQLRPVGGASPGMTLLLQGALIYGSGGTTADAWVQTSFDGGVNWNDIANFHFTTAAGRALFNLSSLTVKTTQITAFTDGTLTANTANDGMIGNFLRVKYTTTGTYAGNTVLRVDAICLGMTLGGVGS